jgi:STIP1 family protein 1
MSLPSQVDLQEKSLANALFAAGRYGAARDKYTELLSLRPPSLHDWAARQFFSALLFNRGLANSKLQGWAEAEADARAALDLDPSYFKACYTLGTLLLQRSAFMDAVAQLEKALDLNKRQKRGASEATLVLNCIAKARYQWFRAREEEERHRLLECEALVTASLRADCNSASAAQRWHASILSQPFATPVYLNDPVPLNGAEGSDPVPLNRGGAGGGGGAAAPAAASSATKGRPASELEARVRVLGEVFEAQRKRMEARDIPEWVLDPVTLELMEDAVIATTSGHSFDKKSILACLAMKKECPLSRAPLTEAQLVPNWALRSAINEWVSSRPWSNPKLARNVAGDVVE